MLKKIKIYFGQKGNIPDTHQCNEVSYVLDTGMSHDHDNNYSENEIILHNMPLQKIIFIMEL